MLDALQWGSSATWVTLSVVLALLLWALTVFHGPRREQPVLALLEAACLALALAGLVITLAQPYRVLESGAEVSAPLAVLVDASGSMGLADEEGARSDQVDRLLERLGEDVEVLHFSSQLQTGAPSSYTGRETLLQNALLELQDRSIGRPYSGVALITDGLDRSPLREEWKRGEGLNVPELGVPVTLFAVGSEEPLADLRISEIRTSGFAFLRTSFELKVEVEGRAWPGWEVPLELSMEGQTLLSQTVVLNDEGWAEAVFTLDPNRSGYRGPRRPGRYAFEIHAPIWEGDAAPGNNSAAAVLRILRENTRVLQVCGAPSLDEKFLRLLLKQDPSIDLVSFFILRTNEDLNSGYSNRELSLIPFPYERLFSEQLWSFDVVIFQNFDYQPFFRGESETLLSNLREHVRQEGRALVMLGGDRSFDLGDYADSPLADVLPVQLGLPEESSVDLSRFSAQLTPAGAVHPVTRLLPDAQENVALWSGLSQVDGIHLSRGLSPDSASLLQHPSLTDQAGSPLPLLAVREAGAGRTMAFLSDSSWRWVMSEAAEGRGNQAYLRFWKNAFRWLVQDPEGDPVQISPLQENYLIQDRPELLMKVRGVDFRPVAGAQVRVTVVNPEGQSEQLEGWTSESGDLLLAVETQGPGAYRIQAEAELNGVKLGAAQSVFAVTSREPELTELESDLEFIQALAEAMAGQWVAPQSWSEPLRDETVTRDSTRRVEEALWADPRLIAWIGIFGGLSWWFRRRGGAR